MHLISAFLFFWENCLSVVVVVFFFFFPFMKLFGSSCHFSIFRFSVINFFLFPFYFVLLIFHHYFLNFWLVFFQFFFYTSSCNFSIFFLSFFFLLFRSSTSQIFSLKVCIISAFSLVTLISLWHVYLSGVGNESGEQESIPCLLTYFYLGMGMKLCGTHTNLGLNKVIDNPKPPHRISTLIPDIKVKLLFYF